MGDPLQSSLKTDITQALLGMVQAPAPSAGQLPSFSLECKEYRCTVAEFMGFRLWIRSADVTLSRLRSLDRCRM